VGRAGLNAASGASGSAATATNPADLSPASEAAGLQGISPLDAAVSPGSGVAQTTAPVGVSLSGAAAPAWSLSLPGKAALLLRSLALGKPTFSIREAAVYAGLGLRWRSSEKLLELSSPPGAKGKLVLGDAYLVLKDRRIPLASPMVLAQGAPALDAGSLISLLQAMGRPQAALNPASAEAVQQAPLALTPANPNQNPNQSQNSNPKQSPTQIPFQNPDLKQTLEAVQAPAEVPLVPLPTAHVSARPLTGAQVRTIVVDAGHGGKDPGARGPDGLREKDVCLDIALRLRRELNEQDPGLRVVLTRDDNYFVTLQGRTAIANHAKGDLFISIHNNASPDPDTHGTQVFFYDSQSSDRAASDLSMRENAEANQLDILMTDLAKSIVRDQSIGFATLVQRALGHAINLKHRDISYAPFYVLARTEMPAILVEVAFITNPHEERLLGDAGFRQRVASSIAQGVEDYARLAESKP
jgi:N-acetylmuramoyl-L-alanine amidase